MATYASILGLNNSMDRGAWGLRSMGSQRVGHDWATRLSLSDSQLITSAVVISGERQRNSAIHTHVSIFPQTPLPSRLPHNIEPSSLCYVVGLCWLSILNIAVCTCPSQTFNCPFPPSFPHLATISSSSKSVNLFLFCKQVHLCHFFLDSLYKGCYRIFLILCPTYFTQHDNL